MPLQVYPKNEIPPSSPNLDNAQINLTSITWKNEEQQPQGDSVKPEPSDIMMGTMPTQRKFNLPKAKGKGQRQKRKRISYYFGKHINKVSQRCYPQKQPKIEETSTIWTFHKMWPIRCHSLDPR